MTHFVTVDGLLDWDSLTALRKAALGSRGRCSGDKGLLKKHKEKLIDRR